MKVPRSINSRRHASSSAAKFVLQFPVRIEGEKIGMKITQKLAAEFSKGFERVKC